MGTAEDVLLSLVGKTSGTSSSDKFRNLTMTSFSENVRKPSSEVDEEVAAAVAPETAEEAPRGEEEVEEEEQMEAEEGEGTREE